MRFILLSGLTLTLALSASAATRIDDSDLSSGSPMPAALSPLKTEGRVENGVRVFKAQQVGTYIGILPGEAAVVSGKLLLTDPQGKEVPARLVKVLLGGAEAMTDENGIYKLQVPGGMSAKTAVRFRLENAYWSITDPESGKAYEWEAGQGTFRLDPNTANGKIGYIQLQLLEAVDLFNREGIGMGWYSKRLTVAYPADADYFTPWGFTLNLTKPEQWDVNLHEFGHSVMDAGLHAHGGGGQHKIDECYNEGLALSEGWATFFAAVTHLDRGDEDAKFQFLVPRRAPIRIENVPDDVCKGDASEWRVSAGLWDLYDTHVDGNDRAAFGFGRLWKALQSGEMGGFGDAFRLVSASLSPEELAQAKAAVEQNTLSTTGTLARRRWWPFPWPKTDPKGIQELTAPDFDGSRSR